MILLVTEVVPLQYQMAAFTLPKIGLTFPAAGSNVNWTITIAGIVGGATIALLGKAGDVFGKKRLLVLLSLLSAVGALMSAAAPNWAVFLTGRGIGGVALGMAVVNLSLVRDLFPRRWIPIAVGFVGTGFAFSAIFGPLLFGVLTDSYNWRADYWFLFIYALVITPLFALVVPESPVRVPQRFDVVGAAAFGGGIALVSVYLSEGGSWGWGNGSALGYLIGGLVALAAFVGWELRTRSPMLDLALIRRPGVYLVILAIFFVTGLQNVVNNFVSGLILVFEHPVQVGDFVEVGTIFGEVRKIGFRASVLRTPDGADVIVPNSELIGSRVINWSLFDRLRRISISVTAAYGTDPDRVIEILVGVARKHPAVLANPAPLAVFDRFGDSALNFTLFCWSFVDTFFIARSKLTIAVNDAFKEAGIQIPFPQQDVHVHWPESGTSGDSADQARVLTQRKVTEAAAVRSAGGDLQRRNEIIGNETRFARDTVLSDLAFIPKLQMSLARNYFSRGVL